MTTLDPAFAALIQALKKRDLLDSTVVMCGGEFGRTPSINPAGGRDHWPHGFSVALAGGGLAGGRVIGETDPEGSQTVKDPVGVADLHATIFQALGVNHTMEHMAPVGRPLPYSTGKVIAPLLS